MLRSPLDSPIFSIGCMVWFIFYAGYHWHDADNQFMVGLNVGFACWAFVTSIKNYALSDKRSGT